MKRHPVWSFLWLLGLFLMAFVQGVAVDPATQDEFFDKVDNANDIFYRDVHEAALQEQAAYNVYYANKGWLSCDAECERYYNQYLQAQEYLRKQQSKHQTSLSEAKQTVGIFSQFGVQ